MEKKYQIVVLGPVPYNHITNWKNEVYERYGAITYPVMALAKLFMQDARIIPVTHLRKKDEQTVKILFKGEVGVDLQHINSDLDQGDVIRTKIIDEQKYLEKQYGFMNPILPQDVRDLLNSDVFLFVPLTDYEIQFETLEFVKTYSKATVVFDAHGPTTAMTSLGDRVPKFWVDRDLWLPYIDVLVMNIEEVKCSWFAKEYTLEQLEDRNEVTQQELDAFAEYCLNLGVKALYITLEKRGCVVYFKKDGQVKCEQIKAIPTQVVSTIGCGEAFMGGLTYGLLTTNDFVKAAYYGNAVGAARCEGLTYDVFKSGKETKQIVENNYHNS